MIDRYNTPFAHRTPGHCALDAATLTTAQRRYPVRAVALSLVVAGIVAALSVCAMPATARPAIVAVRAGTTLTVSVVRPVSSHNARVGDRFSFRATRAVVVHGWVVIRKGALGGGDVIKAEGAGRNGRPGKLALRFHWISAADGSTIALSAARNTSAAEGRRRTGAAITTASHLFAPSFFGPAPNTVGSVSNTVEPAVSAVSAEAAAVVLVARNVLGAIAGHFTWGRDVTIDPRKTLGVYVARPVYVTAKRRAMTT